MINNELPQEPGFYIWNILDWNYLEIGLVQVLKDSTKHQEYLKTREPSKEFFMYENDEGTVLTMYHQAYPNHMPDCDETGKPCVDGYRKVEFNDLFPEKS